MRRSTLIALALLAAASAAPALEVAEALQRAVDGDGQVQVLRVSLENALIAARRADLDPGFAVSLTSGKAKISRSQQPRLGDPAETLSLAPGMTVQLASPLGTQVSVSVPTTYDLASLSPQRSTPTVKVTQPLNDLLGLPTDTLASLELRRAVETARVDLAKRVQAVEKDVLSRLRALWAAESALGELAVQIEGARRDLEQARALGTYAPGTSSLARLEQALRSLERKRELAAAKQARDLRDLSRVVGVVVERLPAAVPAAELVLPTEAAAASAPDVALARFRLNIEEARLNEQVRGKTPALAASGAYSRSITERLGREITTSDVSVGVSLAFDHLTISAGPGMIEETGTLYFGAEITWSPPSRRLDDLDKLAQRNLVRAREAELAAAERSYLASRAELENRILDLSLQAQDLALSRSVAELALAETAAKHAGGLVDDLRLAQARWDADRIAYDEKLLAVDRLLARLDIDGLTMRSKPESVRSGKEK